MTGNSNLIESSQAEIENTNLPDENSEVDKVLSIFEAQLNSEVNKIEAKEKAIDEKLEKIESKYWLINIED